MIANPQIEVLGNRTGFDYSRDITSYVLVSTRLIAGYWSFHTGVVKIIDEPFNTMGCLANAPATSPLQDFFVWAVATPWLFNLMSVMAPWSESLISLRLIVDALIRLTAFLSGVLMMFFYLEDAEQDHDVVNDDLFELMIFVVVDALVAGRILDLDAIIEKMEFIRQRPALKRLFG